MKDLDFISGNFLTLQIPKEKRYLLKYFRNDLQRSFLKYYLVFGEFTNFTNHTGYYCTERLLFRLKARYLKLITIYDKAKKSLSEKGMEILNLMEHGKIPLTKLKKMSTIYLGV